MSKPSLVKRQNEKENSHSPIKRLMLHLRPRLPKLPPKHQLHIHHKLARQLNLAHVRRMILGSDIVVLQNARGVEVVYVAGRTFPSGVERAVVEMPHHALDVRRESAVLRVRGADGAEAAPEA